MVHYHQQRGNQDRDECDVHRDQVLGEAGYESNQEYKGCFFRPYHLGDFPCCNVCQTGPSDGYCQGSQQDVAESGFRVAAHPADQDAHRFVNGQAAGGSGHNGCHQDGEQDVHLEQAQDGHDNYGDDDGVG